MSPVNERRHQGSPITLPLMRSSVARQRFGTLTADAAERAKAGHKMGHHGAKLRELERPAGAIETGAATAYDPIIGASQVRSTYGVQGTGMAVAVIDTGVDYNNPALGGGFGPSNKVIAGFDFADNSSQSHGDDIATRYVRRRPDRLRRPQ